MEKSYFDSKSNVISKTLNLSNNYWLYSRKAKKFMKIMFMKIYKTTIQQTKGER